MSEHVVFLDRASVRADFRRPDFDHVWIDHSQTLPQEVVGRLSGATIAISNKVPIMGNAIAQLPTLRMIAVCATGTNNVDLDACRARGIVVSNIRDYATHTVPEHVFMLMLALRRNLLAYRAAVQAGEWQRAGRFCLMDYPIEDLHGATLGIVGGGALGSSVHRLAEAFGMRVLLAERKGAGAIRAGYASFDTVLADSDVITLHLPLTPETRHLIGTPELARMRKTAILINTARGGLVDESALAAALKQRRIAGAAFDVLTEEPPRSGNPLLDLDLPNFILTPHNAWASRTAMQAMADQLIENLEAFARAAPRNRVV